MKTIILTTLMVITTSTAFAGKDCGSNNTLVLLSSAAEEIQAQAAADNRKEIDRTSDEYKALNAIGVVTKPGTTAYGTGFLISPCHVLTNSHVALKDPRVKENGEKVQFSVGQTADKKKQFSQLLVEGTVVAHGTVTGTVDKNGNFVMNKESANSDWAVIKLSKPVGNTVGYISYSQVDYKNLNNMSVVTAGFPGNRTKNGADLSNIYGDTNCKIAGVAAGFYLLHTCQATPGQSGSPILAKDSQGNFHAVGMISGNTGFGMSQSSAPDKANVAVNFSSGKALNVNTDGDQIVNAVKANSCD